MNDREAVAAELRARVTVLDEATPVPSGLLERVTARPARDLRPALSPRRRWSTVVLAAVAVTGLAVGLTAGIGWQRMHPPVTPADGGRGVELVVFNAEAACQSLRTIECSLGVRADPRATTTTPPVARVWHGERVVADCVVLDGKPVTDEAGVTSNRWYRISTRDGVEGYLPGVRTRNTTEVAHC